MFGFFRRKREISDPVVNIWVKWFTTDINKKDNQLSMFPNLAQVMSQISLRVFTRKEINATSTLSERDFFVELFELKRPIEEFEAFHLLVSATSAEASVSKIDKIFHLVAPPVFQYLIRFMYHFPHVLDDEKESFNWQWFLLLLHFIMNVPGVYVEDYMMILTPMFETFAHIFANYGPNEFECDRNLMYNARDVLSLFHGVTSSGRVPLSAVHLPIFEFYRNYYLFWITRYQEPSFTVEQLTDCISICRAMISLDREFSVSVLSPICHQMISSGLNLMSYIFLSPTVLPANSVFALGFEFLCLFKYIATLSPPLAKAANRNEHVQLLMLFIFWTLKTFPIVQFEEEIESDTVEAQIISSEFSQSANDYYPKPYELIRDDTFPQQIEIVRQNSSVDVEAIVANFQFEGFDHVLLQEQHAKDLIELLRSLCESEHGPQFAESVTIATAYIVKSVMERKIDDDQPMWIVSCLLMFCVQLLYSLPSETTMRALRDCDGFNILFRSVIFQPAVSCLWTVKGTQNNLKFFGSVRNYVFRLLANCFISVPDYAQMILNLIGTFIERSTPQLIDEVIPVISRLFLAESKVFISALSGTDLTNILVKYQLKLRAMQLKLLAESFDQKYPVYLRESRLHVLALFDDLMSNDEARYLLLCSGEFVDMLFQLLFEPKLQLWALGHLGRGLQLDQGRFKMDIMDSPFHNIFGQSHQLYQTLSEKRDDVFLNRLAHSFLEKLISALSTNRKSLLPFVKIHSVMQDIANVPFISTSVEEQIKLVDRVLRCFIPIVQGNTEMAILSKGPMKTIVDILRDRNFGTTTIDLLLQLVFERDIHVEHLPASAEIQNHWIIHFVHEATKHLNEHSEIFAFFGRICERSVNNKLHIFKSKMPMIILKYIQGFENYSQVSPMKQNSITALLNLFAVVSSFIFEWKTFYKAIQTMWPINNTRRWQADLLTSCFAQILLPSQAMSSSFFHLDGKNTAMILPNIPGSCFSKGWSFMVRFELGAIIGPKDTKPRLLSLVTTAGQKLEILFEGRKPMLSYQPDIKRKKVFHVHCDVELVSNQWFHFVMTVLNNDVAFFLDGECIKRATLRKPIKLDRSVDRGAIASSAAASLTTRESPLIVNLVCAYMFSVPLPENVIQLMARLPLDFVYTFSPSYGSVFPGLSKENPEVFNENINSSLIFCFNARMTDSNNCANLAANSIGNAQVKGQIIPFSADFRDVTENVGGLKTFLPLFEQASMPSTDNIDGKDFLVTLIGLFIKFCASSSSIRAEFVKTNGLMCLRHVLAQVNPQLFQKRTINQIIGLWNEMDCDEFRLNMANDIWFDFPLWKRLAVDIRGYVFKQYKTIFSKSIEIMLESVTVGKLLQYLCEEEVEEVRLVVWEFLEYVASLKFSSVDKEAIYLAAFFDPSDIKFRLELLDTITRFVQSNTQNFNTAFPLKSIYGDVRMLINDPSEMVRIKGVNLLIELSRVFTRKDELNVFAAFIRKSILLFNHFAGTLAMWSFLCGKFLEDTKLIGALLPLISHISCYYVDMNELHDFIRHFCQEVTASDERALCIAECDIWYFWLLHLLLQSHKPRLDFDRKDDLMIIFGTVLGTIILKGLKSTTTIYRSDEVIGFLQVLMESKNWDSSFFMRNILCNALDFILEQLKNSQSVAPERILLIAQYVVEFVFFISSKERYFDNVELHAFHDDDCLSRLAVEIDDRPPIHFVMDMFGESPQKYEARFSARIDKNGNWIDSEVALKLVDLIITSQISVDLFVTWSKGESKMRLSDICAMILAYAIQCQPEITSECHVKFMALFTKNRTSESSVLAFNVYGAALYRIAWRHEQHREVYQALCDAFQNSGAKPSEKGPFTQEYYRDFAESHKDVLATFYLAVTDKATTISSVCLTRMEMVSKILKHYLGEIRANGHEHEMPSTKKLETYLDMLKKERARQILASSKVCKRLFRVLSSNNGPWCTQESDLHWQLWKLSDSHFRRLFMRQNLNFDPHLSAVRDPTTDTETMAQLQISVNDLTGNGEADDEIYETRDTTSYSFSTEAQLITVKRYSRPCQGTFFMSSSHAYFIDEDEKKTVQFTLAELEMVLHRSYLHVDSGIEFFLSSKRSYLFNFATNSRNRIINKLRSLSLPKIKILQTGSLKDVIAKYTEEWVNREISNYEYLMWLNLFAGRSFNDLSQYPVFPWILSNYDSETIDLEDESNYRDLSKPIGALNEQRLEQLKQTAMDAIAFGTDSNLYRVHYSNSFYVLHYLIRMEPFTTVHIEMQDEKFDCPNRIFSGIGRSYEAVTSMNADFREIIPEFFTLPDFLINSNKFQFGINPCTNEVIDDVILPKWAKSATEFIHIHRQALESEYVSKNLHKWIDLIFGFAQTGQAAVDANNTFFAESYESCLTKDVLKDRETTKRIQGVAASLGITPKKLFTLEHPQRKDLTIPPPFLRHHNFHSISNRIAFFENGIRFMCAHDQNLYVVTCQLELYCGQISKFIESDYRPVCSGSISKFLIMPPTERPMPSRSFAFLRESKLFASSSLWDNSFHVFRMDQSAVITHASSYRQKFSLIAGLVVAGDSKLLTSWSDSSLTLWDLKDEESKTEQRPMYRINPHLTSLVDFDCDPDLGMIASVDKSRKVVLSLLSTGQYIREFFIESPGKDNLKKIMLFNFGYVVVLSHKSLPRGHIETIVRVWTVNGIKVEEKVFPGVCIEWCKCEADVYGCDLLCLGFTDNLLVVCQMPMLDLSFQTGLEGKAVSIQYLRSSGGIIVGDDAGYVSMVSIK